jgi:hypothetical protein
METLESILRFAGSYPMWARLLVIGCLAVAIGTLILAPRSATPQTPKAATPTPEVAKKERQVFMHIKPLQLFPDRPNAEVQLSILVNGSEYRHPSVAGVEWMKVGPAMSEKIIELPTASRYDVRFEMRLRDGPKGPTKLRAAQKITYITTLPFSEEYSLYDIDGDSRAAGVSAVVSYEVYAQ